MTPQFARVGIGVAADAAVPLKVSVAGVGNQIAAIIDAPAGNPILTVGTQGADSGGFIFYDRGLNTLQLGIHGHTSGVTVDSSSSLTCAGNMDAASYSVGGTTGFTGVGAFTNFTFVFGICTAAS